MRKSITIIIGILLVAASGYIAWDLVHKPKRQRPKKASVAPTVFVDTVQNSQVPIKVLESGRLVAKNTIDIYAEVQGVMEPTSKEFKPGVSYRKGQTIVKIRDNDYHAKLQAQKSNLQNLITSILPDLRLDYPEAYQQWDAYLRKFDMNKRVPPLPKPTSDKEKYFVTGRNIYTTYYNTKNMEIVMDKYNLRAPFNGILTDVLVNTGSLVRPGQKLGEFIDPSVYEMQVPVSKALLKALKVGKLVEIHDPGDVSKKWEGKISRINGKVDPTTQTVNVYIELRGAYLRAGMFLEAKIFGNPVDHAIEIPRNLLVNDQKVYILQDSVLQLQDIQPVYFNKQTAVIKGLENGQLVISRLVPGAYAGMPVKVYQGKGK